jgi:branched-chain amino acid transport system ATP-binding protein
MILTCSGLRAGYGKKEVLRGVDLAIPRGSVVALVGPNGAGKTTLVNAVMGFVASTSGRVVFDSRVISDYRPSTLVRLGIGLVPSGARAFGELSVDENLRLGGYILGSQVATRTAMDWVWECFPIIRERGSQYARTLSGGERQMLAIGRALMLRPRFLMLDEPSLGLSPLMLQSVLGVLKRLCDDGGMTILLVEQNVRAAFSIATHAYVMSLGRIVHEVEQPDPGQLPEELTRAFLGG